MCRKTSKRGSHLKRKKKENRAGLPLWKKTNILAHKYARKRRRELSCDFEDDESKRESKEYAGIRERKNSFCAGSCLFVARFFRFVSIYSLSSS
jgi:hypothetical protein